MLSSPLMLISLVKGFPRSLHLTSINMSIGAFLVQKVEGIENSVYYLRRLLRDTEINYSPIERNYLALIPLKSFPIFISSIYILESKRQTKKQTTSSRPKGSRRF